MTISAHPAARAGVDRSDHLVARVLLALPAAAAGVDVARRALAWVRDEPARVAVALDDGVAVPDGAVRGATGRTDAAAVWSVPDAGPLDHLLALAPAVLSLVVLALAAVLLGRVVADAARGRALTTAGVRRLRTCGWVLALYGVVAPFAGVVAAVGVLWPRMAQPAVVVRPHLADGWPLLVGLLLLLLAGVFDQGARYADDVDGLV